MDNEELEYVTDLLKKNGIVVFPTDTAYGMGCSIASKKGIERLYKVTKQPLNKKMPILVSSIDMALQYLQPLKPKVKALMRTYWPGALTIVYPCKVNKVYPLIRGNGPTLGVRIPDHPLPLKIIKKLKFPLIGTSANYPGKSTPFSFNDLDKDLILKVDYVILGTCSLKKVSTVIDCSVTPFKIIRAGGC